jgi:hypothetical protein
MIARQVAATEGQHEAALKIPERQPAGILPASYDHDAHRPPVDSAKHDEKHRDQAAYGRHLSILNSR